jgi:DNA repair exonuclease SbcCD ATPase subunit
MKIQWRKSLMYAAILAVALPGASVFASEVKSDTGISTKSEGLVQAIKDKRQHKAEAIKSHIAQAVKTGNPGVHKEAYMLLLAEKYAPETAADWNSAFAERERLTTELKALKPTEEERAAAKEERKEKLQDIQEQRKSGELTKDELQTLIQELKSDWKEKAAAHKEEREAYIEERSALRQSFTAAIESGDAEQIRTALAAWLEHMKTGNERLAKMISELQAAGAN